MTVAVVVVGFGLLYYGRVPFELKDDWPEKKGETIHLFLTALGRERTTSNGRKARRKEFPSFWDGTFQKFRSSKEVISIL